MKTDFKHNKRRKQTWWIRLSCQSVSLDKSWPLLLPLDLAENQQTLFINNDEILHLNQQSVDC